MSASVDDLTRALATGPVVAYGMPAAYAGFAAARLSRSGPVIIVVPDENLATTTAADLRFWRADQAGELPAIAMLPAIDGSPYADLTPDRTTTAQRLTTLFRMTRPELAPAIVIATATALCRRTLPRAAWDALGTRLAKGDLVGRDELAARLVECGYLRSPIVEDAGTFAIRGGVVDVFSPIHPYPARVELFGDEVESVRLFEPNSQRTLRELPALYIHPVRETIATGEARAGALRTRIRDVADHVTFPSKATRQLLEQLDRGEPFVGIETLTPAFHDAMDPPSAYAPADATWLIVDPDGCRRAAGEELEHAAGRYQTRVDAHLLAFPPAAHYVTLAEYDAALAAPRRRISAPTLELADRRDDATVLRFAIDDHRALRSELDRLRHDHAEQLAEPVARAVRGWCDAGLAVVVAADSATRADRLAGLLDHHGVAHARAGAEVAPASLADGAPVPTLVVGALADGFTSKADRLAAVTAADVFGAKKAAPPRSARSQKKAKQALLGATGDFSQLTVGDYLVHQLHGVGRYQGVVRLSLDGKSVQPATATAPVSESRTALPPAAPAPVPSAPFTGRAKDRRAALVATPSRDLDPVRAAQARAQALDATRGPAPIIAPTWIDALQLEYDGGRLFLPVYRLGEVQRYVGAEGHEPRIDKLGGATWEAARGKVTRQVRAFAEELLLIYAQRRSLPGHPFPPADEMFRDFEATFPFEETPDQQAAIDAVMADMEAPRAMDRLVCGDVGYGKTEVALRAIFRAAIAGKQAALLAPTTVLVEQHARTMTERFGGWPIKIGKLSRFQTKAEQLATVRELAAGTIDCVVGTHRLLSADVRWKDLGLIVIDEEQRFGVAHKERLKRMRTQLDVLNLTATPIPRTLHLAMTGLRDLSIIATPPADRRAVRTFVSRVDDEVIREGIQRELARGGQIFWITNHISGPRGPGAVKDPANSKDRTIGEWADYIHRLVPTARIAIAHGQLPEGELEQVMVDFVGGKHDILVSTTIVESGLDIPRANTMFVSRADAFGLSQLYQLRGRVGRSKERAYCYLLVPEPDQLSDHARRRLEALQRFTELGAGFHIASQDLEIRGGGELLGARQSGSIATVGFETYVRLLDEAVAEAKGEPVHNPIDPELTVDMPGFIPDDYVPDPGHRLDLYKRLSSAEDDDDLRATLDEIADRFGPLPGELILLADQMGVKALARRLGAVALELTRTRIAVALGPGTPLDPRQFKSPWRLTPDGRATRALTQHEGRAPAEAARQHLQALLSHAT